MEISRLTVTNEALGSASGLVDKRKFRKAERTDPAPTPTRSASKFLKTIYRKKNPRRDGVEYFDGDDERFSDRRPADKLFNEIFGKPGK